MESDLSMGELALQKDMYLTQEQMAERLGVSVATVCVRLKKHGLEPAVPANRKLGIPAVYNMQAFFNLEEEEEEAKLKEKREALIDKHVSALTEDERRTVVHETLNALSAKDAMRLALEAAMFAMQKADDERVGLEDRILELETKLDLADNTFTCETFAVRELCKGITREQAAGITRKLHTAGKEHICKAVITGSTYPACIWKRVDMEYAVEQGWFE